LNANDRATARADSIVPYPYMDLVKQVYDWHMFDEYLAKGWTPRLARRTKNNLMPLIIHAVLFSWYHCVWKAAHASD
jgi:hypothetical protein